MLPMAGVATPAGVARRRKVGGATGDVERGSATLELVIVFPLLLLVVTAIIQYGLWFHARSLALAAAEEGVGAARSYQAGPGAGATRAGAFLDLHAGDSLTAITITAGPSGADRVRVQVTGRAISLLPGVPGPVVDQSADGPIERFTAAGVP